MRRLSRRAMLEATLGGLALAGCGDRAPAAPTPAPSPTPALSSPQLASPPEPVRLPRVRVAEDRILRTVVGLRPYRKTGFRVEVERLGETTVVHNYGHGGGGITLSWGTSELAVEEAWKTGHTRFAVLGCGAVGLATARLLQRRGAAVTIYARDLPPSTTSNLAGGQWLPSAVMEENLRTAASDERLALAARLSHRAFGELAPADYGIRELDNYVVSDEPLIRWWEQDLTPDLYPGARLLGPGEHPFAAQHARLYRTWLIEPSIYLPAMLRDVLRAGGKVVVRELVGLDQIAALPERAVVNCTGLGAKPSSETTTSARSRASSPS
jgi:D-amino-acid oxidase